jgi:hypothetical protein
MDAANTEIQMFRRYFRKSMHCHGFHRQKQYIQFYDALQAVKHKNIYALWPARGKGIPDHPECPAYIQQ